MIHSKIKDDSNFNTRHLSNKVKSNIREEITLTLFKQ